MTGTQATALFMNMFLPQASLRGTPLTTKAACVSNGPQFCFYFFSSPMRSQSTDLPNSRLMASSTAAPGSLWPEKSGIDN
jgi:hypothetical protein